MMISEMSFNPPLVLPRAGTKLPSSFPLDLKIFGPGTDKSAIYALRYRAFIEGGVITPREDRLFCDAYDDLDTNKPEGFEAGPTENPEDENVEMDQDEDLPWPNPELIKKWWFTHRLEFTNGTRYLLGKPMAIDSLNEALRMANNASAPPQRLNWPSANPPVRRSSTAALPAFGNRRCWGLRMLDCKIK